MRPRIGRNAPCWCESGLKFKKCHGMQSPPPLPRNKDGAGPTVVPLLQALDKLTPEHGQPAPSTISNGYRMRQVGELVYPRPPEETFHEFLVGLIPQTLGIDWSETQTGLPVERRHQIARWFEQVDERMRSLEGDERFIKNGIYETPATGATMALLTLGYDLYHLLHRGELPPALIERLKHPAEFQGARYEIAVAAICVRADFKIRFIEDKTQKHCEFIALDPGTGVEIAVEAKSRRRTGMLHEPGDVDEVRALRGDVEGLINKALEQGPPDLPFLCFVDVNVPPVAGIPLRERAWFQDIWATAQSFHKSTPERPADFNGLIFTSFSFHWDGPKPATRMEHAAIFPGNPRNTVPPDLLRRIMGAVDSYARIPHEV